MYKSYLDSELGLIEIVGNDMIEQVELVSSRDFNAMENDVTIDCKKQLLEYFDGTREVFDININFIGTEFQKNVWNALLKVPFGKTVSYLDIANMIDTKGVQAVGSAVGKNPILIICPCHRIINHNGKIGGFSSGLDKKIKLMEIENIVL